MPVREFDGVDDDLVTSVGALSGMGYGTFAFLFQMDSFASDFTAFGFHDGVGVSPLQVVVNNSADIIFINNREDGNFSDISVPTLATGTFYLAVIRKATGTNQPRLSLYNFDSQGWFHGNGTQSIPDWSTVGTEIRVSDETSDFFNGLFSARAAWSNILPWSADATGDAELESAGLELSLSNWVANSPSALWAFNQESTAIAVEDLTGNGADQTSITGTTVVTDDDPPGFDFNPVREFDGVNDDIQTDIGALANMQYGTTAFLVRRLATNNWDELLVFHNSSSTGLVEFAIRDDNESLVVFVGTDFSNGPVFSNTTDWFLVVIRKATGDEIPRFSVYNLTSGVWVHQDGSASVPDWTAPGVSGFTAFTFEGSSTPTVRIAARAAWSNRLGPDDTWTPDAAGDREIEAAGLQTRAREWLNTKPDAFWLFNQDSTTEDVVDLTGNGADQSAITGTAIASGDPPSGFQFGLNPVRRFTRVDNDDLACDTGALANMHYGTVAVLFQYLSAADDNGLFVLESSTDSWLMSVRTTTSEFLEWRVGVSASTSGTALSSGVWYLAVVRKDTGGVQARFSIYNFSTKSWAHSLGANNVPDHSAPDEFGRVRFRRTSGDDPPDIRIAARAAWADILGPSGAWTADASGDTAVEAAKLELGAQGWYDSDPDALWLFDQNSVDVGVSDITGGGAVQSEISGTSIVLDEAPEDFNFTIVGGPIAEGGDNVYDQNGFRYHEFTTPGGANFSVTRGGEVEFLGVAGGGGGGRTDNNVVGAGGGGAGGARAGTIVGLVAGSYPIAVGTGGVGETVENDNGDSGADSEVFGDTLLGGGGGAGEGSNGIAGGSGGGAGGSPTDATATGGLGVDGQGQDGGDNSSGEQGGAGGGGTVTVGGNSVGTQTGGDGGNGLVVWDGQYTIGGGGGGGGVFNASGSAGAGGLGGGGDGADADADIAATVGDPNTGGGGGGGAGQGTNSIDGKDGGSGLVVVRYPFSAPVVEAVQFTTDTTVATAAVALPAGVTAGERLLVVLGNQFGDGGTLSLTSGWSIVVQAGDNPSIVIVEKLVADGTETQVDLTVGTGTWEFFKAWAFRISNHDSTLGTAVATDEELTGTANVDPPLLLPSWGEADTLWIAHQIGTGNGSTISSFPLADNQDHHSNSTNNSAICSQSLRAVSLDPDPFVNDAALVWRSATIAIAPAPSGASVQMQSHAIQVTHQSLTVAGSGLTIESHAVQVNHENLTVAGAGSAGIEIGSHAVQIAHQPLVITGAGTVGIQLASHAVQIVHQALTIQFSGTANVTVSSHTVQVTHQALVVTGAGAIGVTVASHTVQVVHRALIVSGPGVIVGSHSVAVTHRPLQVLATYGPLVQLPEIATPMPDLTVVTELEA